LSPRREKRALLTPSMIRAARALIGLEQAHLAVLAGVTRKTISLIETETPSKVDARRRAVLETVRLRLENEFHIQFIFADAKGGEGVRRGRADV
jgi:DNA-binding XRE family transcriptional regulator